MATDKVERLKGLIAIYEAEATADHHEPVVVPTNTRVQTPPTSGRGPNRRTATKKARIGAEVAVRANDSETQTPLEFRPYGAEG